jgi:hypothetical protein
MSPEKQRVAMAEARGYTHVRIIKSIDGSPDIGIGHHPTEPHSVPDYLNDLNAMHEMEKVLTKEQHIDHMEWLGMCSDDYGQKVWAYVHATAAQRSEAFLRTLNLWTTTPTQPQ